MSNATLWIACTTDEGERYYYCPKTKESKWKLDVTAASIMLDDEDEDDVDVSDGAGQEKTPGNIHIVIDSDDEGKDEDGGDNVGADAQSPRAGGDIGDAPAEKETRNEDLPFLERPKLSRSARHLFHSFHHRSSSVFKLTEKRHVVASTGNFSYITSAITRHRGRNHSEQVDDISRLVCLAGTTDRIPSEFFRSPSDELTDFREKLTNFVKDNELSLSLMKSGGADWVRHPQFVRSSGAPASESNLKVEVSVPVIEDEDDADDDEGDRDFVQVKLTVEKETTVGTFLDKVIKSARSTTSFKLEDLSRCVFKILGTNQWLYERDIPLENFSGVCDAIRAGKDRLHFKIVVMNATNAHQMLHLHQHKKDILANDSVVFFRKDEYKDSTFRLSEVGWPLMVNVSKLQFYNSAEASWSFVAVKIRLWNGNRLIKHEVPTFPPCRVDEGMCRWDEGMISLGALIAKLPVTTTLVFTVVALHSSSSEIQEGMPLCEGQLPMVSYDGSLQNGKKTLKLFPVGDAGGAVGVGSRDGGGGGSGGAGEGGGGKKGGKMGGGGGGGGMNGKQGGATSGGRHNGSANHGQDGGSGSKSIASLTISFETWEQAMVAVPLRKQLEISRSAKMPKVENPSAKELVKLHTLFLEDHFLHEIKEQDKELLWKYRWWLMDAPEMLFEILKGVDWNDLKQVKETYILMAKWPSMNPMKALQFLSTEYCDPLVRWYGVMMAGKMSDDLFCGILPQLVQALKIEMYHDSPLARMLLYRMLMCPHRIGHRAFWLLRSEMGDARVCERFGAVIELYLVHCGMHFDALYSQWHVVDVLEILCRDLVKRPKSERTDALRQLLHDVELPKQFQLCLSAKYYCCGIDISGCKVMDSKQAPLWINFISADRNEVPEDKDKQIVPIIFKLGDDLRQDMMTLQMLEMFDNAWLAKGLDLGMNAYGCIQTGHEVGMIEVVRNSNTIANIQVEYGGGVTGALSSDPIIKYLKEKVEDSTKMPQVLDNFVRTCAGYCVGTYVLGIGDRHPDNIMVTKEGYLFHIDFGHFLGNFKSKFGLQRERAPFVFTPQMQFVIKSTGSERYLSFQEKCYAAYNILRRMSSQMIILFLLMVPAGIPELKSAEDVRYLVDMLHLELSLEDARKQFKKEIKNALKTTTRQIDDMFHNLAHRKTTSKKKSKKTS